MTSRSTNQLNMAVWFCPLRSAGTAIQSALVSEHTDRSPQPTSVATSKEMHWLEASETDYHIAYNVCIVLLLQGHYCKVIGDYIACL